jgi:lipid-A-disaccharide synthase
MSSPVFSLPAPRGDHVDLLVIAGEHSGDEHAACLVRELSEKQPGLVVSALGGPKLAEAGAQLLYDLTASSVVGLVEVLKNYSFFKALFAEVLRWTAEYRPRAVCFVDFPGLNLRLAAALRERGLSVKGGGKIKTLYYISPQIWAWKAGRRFTMARDLDAMAVIFPFEVGCYADTSLPVDFVGHPFLAFDYRPPVHYDAQAPVLLLPGSRKQAVHRIFPVLLAGFRAFGRGDAVVLYPSDDILSVLQAAHPPRNVRLVRVAEPGAGTASDSNESSTAASAVLTSSGTMSMHCALAAIPGAIAYRANPLTYVLGRMLVKVEYLGIANLLLNEPMYPEFIQSEATPTALAGELRAATLDERRLLKTRSQAARLSALLRQPTSGSAGDWVARHLAGR